MSYPKQQYCSNQQQTTIRSPLLQAIDQNNVRLCQDLLSSEKNQVHEKTWNDLTPLHHASLRGQIEILQLFINYGAVINARSTFGETPLHYACRRGDVFLLHILIDHGSDVTATDKQGKTCIHFAALGGSIPAMHYLGTKTELLFDTKDDLGETALQIACMHRHFALLDYLLRKNRTNSNHQNNKGQTVLHIAAQLGSVETVWKILMASNCGLINVHDNQGCNAIDIARKGVTPRHKEVVKTLEYYSKFSSNSSPTGPFVTWWFLLFFPFIYATLIFLLVNFFNSYSGHFALVMFGLLVWFVSKQSHRLYHPNKWPNPIFLGAFAGGIFHCLIVAWSRFVADMWPCYYFAGSLFVFGSVCFYYLIRLVRGDPGFVRHSRLIGGHPGTVLDIAHGRCKESDFCSYTELIRPERTKYCKLCEKLVADLDHHCLFLGNCVARNNHREFIIFIVIVMMMQVFFVLSAWWYMTLFYPNSFIESTASLMFHYEPRILNLCILCIFSFIWESTLILNQFQNIVRGQTTYYSGPRPPLTFREGLRNIYVFMLSPRKRPINCQSVYKPV